ncbi:OmpA family protein [Amaricoccus solimangrovi]|uniref:OmpA family protein n=1 Tax=Amaricoccus solimangrovi TaxID=2589815 RepID=A0A501WHC1_9RHOB|nr:OmpA family protein [Amaricoccus solimangrovi]TPE48202.1 OmpA family protein [Amaricoccus solimangrovi]
MTSDEIAGRFRAQLRSIRSVQADPSVGMTRGLVLIPVAPDEETAAQAEEAATAGGGEAVLTLTPATRDAAPKAVWTLPKEEQVNARITFAFDSAALAASQKPKLREVCAALGQAGVGVLRIIGHTDSTGPWDYNQKLSELRAEEVKRFFVTDCRVPADRLQAVGVGEQFPYDESHPAAAANRRVEFQAIS